ncbi:hypothetical protein [uncultured Roseibium sp.]|uniref:hypothetical protein n=1 Tax=uncultured Roseibium sp. TaxID=1936171 RepID=UPI002597A1C3|nr:hypothetical protein [uncultured Roseibium sp.]
MTRHLFPALPFLSQAHLYCAAQRKMMPICASEMRNDDIFEKSPLWQIDQQYSCRFDLVNIIYCFYFFSFESDGDLMSLVKLIEYSQYGRKSKSSQKSKLCEISQLTHSN